MLRRITAFSRYIDNHSIAELSQLLRSGPIVQTQSRELIVYQWVSDSLATEDQIKQIIPDADVFLVDANINIKLACFDMDSTLIQAEVIDELAEEIGIKNQVAEITERAMRGEIDFVQSFTQRMALLRGLRVDVLPKVYDRIEFMPGAAQLMRGLKDAGAKTVILSGGFTVFAKQVCDSLGMDGYFANVLDESEGFLTGDVVTPIVDASFKASKLLTLMEAHGLETSNVMAVGDGANDIPMLEQAGLGVAIHAKPKVQAVAPFKLNHGQLDDLLFVLGLR